MVSDMDAWQFLLAHRYHDALIAYDERRRLGVVQDSLEIANRCTALLCLGELNQALEGFEKANALAAERLRGETQPYLAEIGAILWLLGRRSDAIITWRSAVDGVLDGSTKFADNAGGVSQCLLLWYGAITDGDARNGAHAEKCVQELAKKSRIEQWPGVLGLFALGKKTRRELVFEACGGADLKEALARADGDLLRRRRLVKTLFYLATSCRATGEEDGCVGFMTECASMENPILEIEWYLARSEMATSVQMS
jgi:tetratricopeptide (TPR) repeat protein